MYTAYSKKEGKKTLVSKLLLDDKPLVILPSLAKVIGLNESIIVQQLHYWLLESKHDYDGFHWIYNTYSAWKEQFPFWSDKTIRRTITKLENEGIIITGNYNKLPIDKTKWYRIDYDKLNILTSPCGQNDQSKRSDCPVEEVRLTTPLPEITSEITSEKEEVKEGVASRENPFNFFEENGFGTIGGHISQKISAWCDDLSDELILEAMKIAVERGAKSWSYVEKILINWAEKKIKTVAQANALILAYKEKQSKQAKPRKGFATRREKLPDWFEEPEIKPKPPIPKKNDNDAERKKAEFRETLKKLREGSPTDGDPLR